MTVVDDFIRDRNARAAAKPSRLDTSAPPAESRQKQAAAGSALSMAELAAAAVFDEDDYIDARNAAAAARPNPLNPNRNLP